jgi:3-hydroxyisobutyrate dehydrogenase-like beta-hydroxyacid dehydrogenase
MDQRRTLGCIGLGAMGEPICGHLLRRSGCGVVGFDLREEPLARLAKEGLEPSGGIEALGRAADVVLLSLPGGAEPAAVAQRLLASMAPASVLIDLGTAPVELTRALAARFAAQGTGYADAPVARTRLAALRGELSATVGAAPATFARVEPVLRCFASEVLHCGYVGAGQVAKLINKWCCSRRAPRSPRRSR